MVSILIIIYFATTVFADCSQANFAKDPTTWGNASCTSNRDCNFPNGFCNYLPGLAICTCSPSFAKPDCSYHRLDSAYTGRLNIGLPFIGFGGIGNLAVIQGYKIPDGVGQLILTVLGWVFLLIILILNKADCLDKFSVIIIFPALIIVAALWVSGMIWSVYDGSNIMQCKLLDANGYAMWPQT